MKEHGESLVNSFVSKTTTATQNMVDSTKGLMNYLNFVQEDQDDVFIEVEDDTSEMQTLKKRKARELSNEKMKKRKFNIGFHHGRLNPLPVDSTFPKMTLEQMIHNYLLGNSTEKILCIPCSTLNT